MELTIISRDTVKPSTKPNVLPKKLSLFDQLTPTTYPEIVLFYTINDHNNFDLTKTLTNLKKSLSETLTIFYPFSGRTKENQRIDEFDSGVPLIAARVNLRLSDYFAEMNKDMESLNKLVPYLPFRKERTSSDPLIAFQVSLFSCGGLALGTSVCHKVSDGATVSHFLNTWAGIFSGSRSGTVEPPNHGSSAALFPPLEAVPENTASLMDELWFMKSNYITRRFFFSKEAVEGLKALARSEAAPAPSRNEAVSCFIWKHVMAASWRASGPKTSVAAHAVNLRPRMKARARDLLSATGNVFWWAGAVSGTAPEDGIELSGLVALTREIMAGFNEEYLDSMVGPGGFEPIAEYLGQLEGMLSLEAEKADVIGFTNWKGYFNAVDFGWGNPVWVGAHGKTGDEFRNLIVLVDRPGSGKAIDAFVTLEEKLMAVLERDNKFLAFAAANSPVIADPIPSSDHVIISSL